VEEQLWRAGMYQILAGLLTEPDETSAAVYVDDKAYYEEVCKQDPMLAGREKDWPVPPSTLAEWQQLYYQSFVVSAQKCLIPVESIYRQWTYDETCSLPIAKEKGHLMSDAALHMRKLYQEYGVELPESMNQQPDHLALELEFMGVLVELGNLERQRIFVREHLDWVVELFAEAREKNIPQYYQNVLNLIEVWLSIESGRLGERTGKNGKCS